MVIKKKKSMRNEIIWEMSICGVLALYRLAMHFGLSNCAYDLANVVSLVIS